MQQYNRLDKQSIDCNICIPEH